MSPSSQAGEGGQEGEGGVALEEEAAAAIDGLLPGAKFLYLSGFLPYVHQLLNSC